jgi:RNA polymerase sigma-70 factor (ECF subfamily)
MNQAIDSFEQLLAGARRGDASALSELCRQYEPRLRMVARVRLGAALRPFLDSVDLVQSVHRSLLVGFREAKFDISTPENLLALALTLLRRKVARQWRHLRRQKRLETGGSSMDLLPRILADLSAPEPDPADAAEFQEQLERLCRRLDATDRQILTLRLDGYTTAEIADQLGMNHVTVRVRIVRLRERLSSSGVLHDWL